MIKRRILVVEDETDIVIFIEDQLEALDYRVIIARDGLEGLNKANQLKPDLIVLDVMMPKMDGFEVCKHLKSNVETKRIPILMLTAKGQVKDRVHGINIGADYYLSKPYDKAEFEAAIKKLLKPSKCPSFDEELTQSIFSLTLKPGQPIDVHLIGNEKLTDWSKLPLNLDVEDIVRQSENAFQHDSRFNMKRLGKDIFKNIFSDHPKIIDAYSQEKGSIKKEEQLHLRFKSDRNFLRFPIEFLHSNVYDFGDYLILNHPIFRTISGVKCKETLSPKWLIQQCEQGESLNILLISSNTMPSIPGVDKEIEALDISLKTFFEENRIKTKIKTILTTEATYDRIREELRECQYHIIHYAGHGRYDEKSPEESCLFFWENNNKSGKVTAMPISELQMLLKGAKTRFFYLSCCYGTTNGPQQKLLDDDFLGIADGIIHARVPAVLGFRVPVSDKGARVLAIEFYKSLAKHGNIDTALLHARREVAALDRNDPTWLSPILIIQD